MCQNCDDDANLDLEDEDEIPMDAESARAFFMAVLEAAEPDAYTRYTSIQIRFHNLVTRLAADPSLISETRMAHGDLINARERLEEAMSRTSNLLAHAAHA